MIINKHYIFFPSEHLIEAAALAGELDMAEVSVWETRMADRSGVEHSRKDVQDAFWAIFCANMIYESENDTQRKFRNRCMELGFFGCWKLFEAEHGGKAEELVEEGKKAHDFLATNKIYRSK